MPALQKVMKALTQTALTQGTFTSSTKAQHLTDPGRIDHMILMTQCDQAHELWLFRKDHDGTPDQGTLVKAGLAATTATTWNTVVIPTNDPATYIGAEGWFAIKNTAGADATVAALRAQIYR